MRRTTPAPARTGAGTGAAGSAQRRTLGRAGSRDRRPRSLLPATRTQSHLRHRLRDSLTSRPLLPPAGRPTSTALTSAGPPLPEAALCSCAPSRAPALPWKAGPSGGVARAASARTGLREATRAGPERGHTHSRDHAPSCRSPGETLPHLVDARGRIGPIPRCSLFPCCSVSLLQQVPCYSKVPIRPLEAEICLRCCSDPKLCGVCCPHPYCKLENLHPGVPGPPVEELALAPFTVRN